MAPEHDEQAPPTIRTASNSVETLGKKETTRASHFDEKQRQSQEDGAFINATLEDQETAVNEDLDSDFPTTVKQPLVVVPRAERRGLFARFAVIAEVTEPTHYSDKTKWLVTAIVALAAAAAPAGSSIIFASLDQVASDFHASATVTNLSVSLFMVSMAIFPLWWSAFSETFGRRTIYVISFAMFIVFAILSALSRNIIMFIVMRLLSGGASASVQAVGAGTVADLWDPHERGRAMGYFYLGPLTGPLIAPIVGGVLAEELGWRSTQWALAVYGLLVLIMIVFALPETLKVRKDVAAVAATEQQGITSRPGLSRTSTRQSVQKKSKEYIRILRMMFIDPLMVLAYLRFPPVLMTVYYSAVTFGTLYVLNISIQHTFEQKPYEYSTIIIGLFYIPNSLGYILSSFFGGKWMDRIMLREARKRRRDSAEPLVLLPEDRMRENAWLGALLYPAALLWYGWTAGTGQLWIVPMIANFFYGIGSMIVFSMVTTMLTEFMPDRSSSGVGLNNFCRNIFSCIGTIVSVPLIDAIGNGWLFTILFAWSLCSCVVIWAMRKFGPRWRKQMEKALR